MDASSPRLYPGWDPETTRLEVRPVSADFTYSDLLPLGADETEYRLLTTEGVSTFTAGGRTFLQIEPAVLQALTAEAMHDISHYLRASHLAQLRRIIDDPEASGNDRFVALDLLKNANISAGGVLPMCQDTGTAIVMGKKSEGVLTGAVRRGVDQPGRVRRVHQAEPALLADGAADHVGREEHRVEPPRPDRALLARPAGQTRRTSCSSWRRAAARRTSRSCSRRRRPCSTRRGCWSSSTRRSARSAPPRARRTTSRSSSAARRPSSR